MTENIKKKIKEHAELAESYSSGFDLREFGLSKDQETKIATMFGERIEFLMEEAVECFLADIWHDCETDIPEAGKEVMIRSKKGMIYSPYSRFEKSDWRVTTIILEAAEWAYCEDLRGNKNTHRIQSIENN